MAIGCVRSRKIRLGFLGWPKVLPRRVASTGWRSRQDPTRPSSSAVCPNRAGPLPNRFGEGQRETSQSCVYHARHHSVAAMLRFATPYQRDLSETSFALSPREVVVHPTRPRSTARIGRTRKVRSRPAWVRLAPKAAAQPGQPPASKRTRKIARLMAQKVGSGQSLVLARTATRRRFRPYSPGPAAGIRRARYPFACCFIRARGTCKRGNTRLKHRPVAPTQAAFVLAKAAISACVANQTSFVFLA